MKNAIKKAERAFRYAQSDIWESQYLCGKGMKRDAKRSSKRAQRRLGKAQANFDRDGR